MKDFCLSFIFCFYIERCSNSAFFHRGGVLIISTKILQIRIIESTLIRYDTFCVVCFKRFVLYDIEFWYYSICYSCIFIQPLTICTSWTIW